MRAPVSTFLLVGVMLASVHGWLPQVPETLVLIAPKPGLEAVPLPSVEALEPSVAEQLRQFHSATETLLATPDLADADLAEAYGVLAQTHHAYQFLDAAEASYLNAIRLAPGDVRWLHLLGHLYKERGQLEDAVLCFEAALAARPDDTPAAVYLGELFLELNRGAEARAHFQSALDANPDDAAALNGLGEEARLDGRLEDAVRYFEAALQQVPAAGRIHYSLGMVYRALGRLEQAQAHLRQVGPVGVRPADSLVDGLQGFLQGERVHLIRGRLAFQAGQFDAAVDAFRLAVDAAPDSVPARVNLGASLAELGDRADAILQFRTAIDIDPDNRVARYNLGLQLAEEGDDVAAVEQFQEVTDRAPDDVEAHRALARSLSILGREEETITSLRAIAARDPGDEDSVMSLAILLTDRARYEEVRDLLTWVNGLFPDRGRTAAALARLLAASPELDVRDGTRALALAQAVYRARPSAFYGEIVTLALAELGRCEEAAAWQRQLLVTVEQDGDNQLAARLRRDLPRYEAGPCRPPSGDPPEAVERR